ncbi:Hcp family type VI secretion system effector [Sphingomonas morindae]|uniref:Type VI secretion system tube protein Hcp n=1 Tax=Sphingomonas morindae TaxID=1541170 RepID=A0ABY4XDY0_9SPHN|nr:type VI secretion system tube protein Hcp [Sphingomonas morindae]USI74900.1 type VI secretion system tube protein Hcp [Sphingomonas morindae]
MAVDMFLKLEGVNGESEDAKHSKEIDIIGWSWGMSNTGTAHLGGGAGTGKANFQDLSVTKFVDLASTPILLSCAQGKHFSTATLTVRKAGGDNPLEYLVITMTEVMVSNVQHGGSSGDERTTEVVSLNFEKIDVKYTEQSKTGSSGGGSPDFKWDILKNQAA